jgi:predicted  nucleic acid-binding Zn ribbon protein
MSLRFPSEKGARARISLGAIANLLEPQQVVDMYSFEIDLFPDPNRRGYLYGEFDDSLSSFISALYQNGQVEGSLSNSLEREGRVQQRGMTPAEDALDPKYFNRYCRESYSRLAATCLDAPESRIVGKVPDLGESCGCPEPSWYVLITSAYAIGSPVNCGDCDQPVPLFRLPFVSGEEEHYALRAWEKTYQACDRLFMLSGIGERFGYRQVSKFNSPLMTRGREICAELAKKTERPFYCYLLKYYGPPGKSCPSCGRPWKLPQALHDSYEFKCDSCFLISGRFGTT